MALSERKSQILSAIVEQYIRTGEPVGSKVLGSILDMGVSSATLRNEMSEMCELGYLEQLHTSSGRVPTTAGYRFYIESLMKRVQVPARLKTAIDSIFRDISNDPEHLPTLAGQALTDLTGLPALCATVLDEHAYVRRVELLPMGRHTLFLVLITSDGIAKSRLCRVDTELTGELIASLDRLVAVRVIGKELTGFGPAFLQTLAAEAQESLRMMPLLSVLFEMVEEIRRSQVSLRGESNLISCFERPENARRLAEFLSCRDALLSLLSDLDAPVGVLFGDDTKLEALETSSIVIAKYSAGSRPLGRIGVIGPMRMSYESLIPSVEYFADQLGRAIAQTREDMEE